MYSTITLHSKQFPQCFTRHTIKVITQEEITAWKDRNAIWYAKKLDQLENSLRQQVGYSLLPAHLVRRTAVIQLTALIKEKLERCA